MISQQTSGTWPRWLAILKISKVPFWFIWITPIIFGYLASAEMSSPQHVIWFIVSILGACVLEAANCIHNELMDREEDRINQPNRATLVASVGEATLWKIAIGGYMSCFLGQIAIAIFVSPWVAILMFVGGVAAPLYNWGLRLKRRPGFAEIAIGWAVFFGYLWGWAWNQPSTQIPPVIWVLAYFFAITALIKDLPDVRGDEQVKASGIFSIRRQWVRKALLLFIYISPYIFVITLVISGVLPVRFLALCLLVILGLTILVVGEKADTTDTMIVAYELAFLYVHLFFLLLFILDTPTNQAIIVATILFVGRIFSVYLGLAPRFVEADFSWIRSIKTLLKKTLKSTILS